MGVFLNLLDEETFSKIKIDERLVPSFKRVLKALDTHFTKNNYYELRDWESFINKNLIEKEFKIIIDESLILDGSKGVCLDDCISLREKTIDSDLTLCHEFIHFLVMSGNKKNYNYSASFINEGLTEILARTIIDYEQGSSYQPQVKTLNYLNNIFYEKNNFEAFLSGKFIPYQKSGDDFKTFLSYVGKYQELGDFDLFSRNISYLELGIEKVISNSINDMMFYQMDIKDLLNYTERIKQAPFISDDNLDRMLNLINKKYIKEQYADLKINVEQIDTLKNMIGELESILPDGKIRVGGLVIDILDDSSINVNYRQKQRVKNMKPEENNTASFGALNLQYYDDKLIISIGKESKELSITKEELEELYKRRNKRKEELINALEPKNLKQNFNLLNKELNNNVEEISKCVISEDGYSFIYKIKYLDGTIKILSKNAKDPIYSDIILNDIYLNPYEKHGEVNIESLDKINTASVLYPMDEEELEKNIKTKIKDNNKEYIEKKSNEYFKALREPSLRREIMNSIIKRYYSEEDNTMYIIEDWRSPYAFEKLVVDEIIESYDEETLNQIKKETIKENGILLLDDTNRISLLLNETNASMLNEQLLFSKSKNAVYNKMFDTTLNIRRQR